MKPRTEIDPIGCRPDTSLRPQKTAIRKVLGKAHRLRRYLHCCNKVKFFSKQSLLTGENTGVGFSVPVATIKRVVPQLLQFGEVRRASLGIDLFWKTELGIGVARTQENGPAFNAGIQGFKIERKLVRSGNRLFETIEADRNSADRILAIDGININSTDDLQETLDRYKPGQEVVVSILRQGRQLKIPLRLGLDR